MGDELQATAAAIYGSRLDRTVKDLQNRLKEQEAALEKLRQVTTPVLFEPSPDRTAQLEQLRTVKAAYESLTPEAPFLPSPESPILALLALRTTYKIVNDTKVSLVTAHQDLVDAEQRLEKEYANLKDANSISYSIESRIQSLNVEIQKQIQKSPSQVARDLMRALKKKKDRYDGDTGRLVKAFNSFIGDHLAAMLAAEELGGPIVGDLLDIDELSLEAGFNAQGKAKRHKDGGMTEDKRQRRLDEIWGQRSQPAKRGKEPWDEKKAAGSEMRELTERLLNALVEAEGGIGDVYVDLDRESAAARFLVRAKVAQFHVRDARKLRLIDFGGDLDD